MKLKYIPTSSTQFRLALAPDQMFGSGIQCVIWNKDNMRKDVLCQLQVKVDNEWLKVPFAIDAEELETI